MAPSSSSSSDSDRLIGEARDKLARLRMMMSEQSEQTWIATGIDAGGLIEQLIVAVAEHAEQADRWRERACVREAELRSIQEENTR